RSSTWTILAQWSRSSRAPRGTPARNPPRPTQRVCDPPVPPPHESAMLHALTAHSIRYDGVMNGIRAATASVVAVQRMDALPRLWDRSYRGMSGRQAQIVEVRIDALVYHFDQAAPSPGGEERVVVVYGFSRPAGAPRDTSRMQGFLGGGIMDPKRGRMDKG